jgi:uncharacterized repeat protein (TIGR03943 family)
MRRDTQSVLLLLVGATLLKVAISGTYVRYVKLAHLPLLVVTGLVLVVVAGVTLWRQIRTSGATSAQDQPEVVHRERAEAAGRAAAAHEGLDEAEQVDDEPDEVAAGGHQEESRIGWLLLVAALALLVFSPPALGSFLANRHGTALPVASVSDLAPLPSGDPVQLTLLDYATRAVSDNGRSLSGRDVRLTGFVIAGPGGTPYLARLVVGCCAADARPVKVGLTGDLPGILTADQWVEVVGRYTDQTDRDPINGDAIPYISVVSVREIAPPALPYES